MFEFGGRRGCGHRMWGAASRGLAGADGDGRDDGCDDADDGEQHEDFGDSDVRHGLIVARSGCSIMNIMSSRSDVRRVGLLPRMLTDVFDGSWKY
ncbi:hypothetical protein [Nonomuraea dietziae]|uniref:hypothetical protein n=1 Tax=Nonomuraea dietziae TaxID=65515 RepID=UPI0031D77E2F